MIEAPALVGADVAPEQTAANDEFGKPYKGPKSYQVEDRGLFHGRDAEAEQLIARILSSRFTLLHAQSGAGKTSLLNACLIPGLESRGWFPVRILPQNDPVASTRAATLQYLLPPPESELMAIRRACHLLDLDEQTARIVDVLARFDALPIRDPRKREIVSPVESATLWATYPRIGAGKITPYACRVIRGSLDLETASEQWRLILSLTSGERVAPLSEAFPLAELIAALESPEFVTAYRSLVSFLDPPGHCSLADFFANLMMVYGQRFSRFGLVLLFDQFEEVFTRFVDVGATGAQVQSDLPDWRLRRAFFEELQALYTREAQLDGKESAPCALPIRFVLSMRSEYIGKLDAVRAFVPTLDQCTAHLQLLTVEEAAKAVRAPAREFGYGYAPECYEQLIADLTKEGRYVEPTHMNIVCEYLWNAKGRELAARQAPPDAGALPVVPLEVYEKEDGVRGIMSSFFWVYLSGLGERERIETIDILEQLITPSGTRNIVERDYLVNQSFHSSARCTHLLAQLVDRTIVRAETRLGGQFIEITHEFLIAPIKEAIQKAHSKAPEHKRFAFALAALERLHQMGIAGGTTPTLLPAQFEALNRQVEDVDWPAWAVEVMFRNAICHEAEPEVLWRWAMRLVDVKGEVAVADLALRIAREFVDATDAATRKRGLGGLGALSSIESASLLLDRALNDPDPEARKHAESVMASLPEPQSTPLRSVLQRSLEQRTGVTYALMGRLQLLGSGIGVAPSLWPLRLRRAMSLWNDLRRGHSWRYWVRGLGSGFVGAVFGFLFASIVLGPLKLLPPPQESGTIISTLTLPIALLLSALIAPWVTPTQLHIDRPAGITGDALIAALITLAVMILASGFVLFGAVDGEIPTMTVLVMVAPLAVAATRVAISLVGGSVSIPVLGFLWTTVTGGFAGLLAAWLGALAISGAFGFDLNNVFAGASFCTGAFTVAWMFTRFDRPLQRKSLRARPESALNAPPERQSESVSAMRPNFLPRQAYASAAVVYALLTVVVFLAVPGSALGPGIKSIPGEGIELKVGTETVKRRISQAPIHYDVNVAPGGGRADFELTLPENSRDRYNIVVEAAVQPDKPIANFDTESLASNPAWSIELEGGQYRLRVTRHEADDDQTVLARLYTRAEAKLGMQAARSVKLELISRLFPKTDTIKKWREKLKNPLLPRDERLVVLKKLLASGDADFSDLQLNQIDFKGSGDLFKAKFGNASLRLANLESANLGGADFSNADLERVSLVGAQLKASNFASAKLQFADLSYANLIDADFTNADLSGASLIECDMTGARVGGAKLSEATIFKDTAWWFASGWTESDIKLLSKSSPHVEIIKATRYTATIERLNSAVKEAPDAESGAIPRNERAWFRATHGVELDKASEDAQLSVELMRKLTSPNPNGKKNLGEALDTKGYIRLQRGDYKAAEEFLKEAAGYLGATDDCESMPKEAGVTIYHLATALERLGRQSDADSRFECAKLNKYKPTHELLLTPRIPNHQ